jgi:two-component system osmolarity sensor histidine kinase EnvZ
MKGQIRPLKRLAIIAETFGRGLDAPELKVSGASEIRQTTNAFNQMRTRIKRFLKQRTDMLAGVSHDLRTPLTRMKLQLSLMKDDNAKIELINDINEMTAMLNSYVSFVRGEAPETIENINLKNLIKNICLSNISKLHDINNNCKEAALGE